MMTISCKHLSSRICELSRHLYKEEKAGAKRHSSPLDGSSLLLFIHRILYVIKMHWCIVSVTLQGGQKYFNLFLFLSSPPLASPPRHVKLYCCFLMSKTMFVFDMDHRSVREKSENIKKIGKFAWNCFPILDSIGVLAPHVHMGGIESHCQETVTGRSEVCLSRVDLSRWKNLGSLQLHNCHTRYSLDSVSRNYYFQSRGATPESKPRQKRGNLILSTKQPTREKRKIRITRKRWEI